MTCAVVYVGELPLLRSCPARLYSVLYVPSVMTVPFASGLATRTTSWTEPEPPAASAPIDQVTTPAESAPPPVADTNVVLTGTVSESTTPVAPEFPVFE